MKSKTTRGMITTPLTMEMAEITIRAEQTKQNGAAFTTVSLADDKRGILISVNYEDVKEVVRGL